MREQKFNTRSPAHATTVKINCMEGDEPLDPCLDPDKNPDPFTRWVGKHTLADVLVEGEPVTALLDLGAQSNLITPALVRKLGLKVGPLHHLVEGKFHLTGVGNIFVNQILGYTVLSLEVPSVKESLHNRSPSSWALRPLKYLSHCEGK